MTRKISNLTQPFDHVTSYSLVTITSVHQSPSIWIPKVNLERLQIIALSKKDSLKLFLSHYVRSADGKEKEEAPLSREFSMEK